MRILFFGSSITQGFWDTRGGWVERIRAHYDGINLQDLKNNDAPTIFNLGVSADTTENILSRIESEITNRIRHDVKPIVVLEIGINDSMLEAGKDKVTLVDYEKNLEKIIELIKPITTSVVFVGLSAADDKLTTPVFWGDYIYANERIKQYEQVMSKVARENDILFIPVFDQFKKALDDGQDLLADGLHPNDDGHEMMAKIVRSQIDKLIG